MENSKFYSQVGQDKYIYENFFKEKKNGVFLDIGAHDGINKSNTYFFEKHLGWKGLCVEPFLDIFDLLKKNRECKCANIAVSNYCGNSIFWQIEGYSEMLSGLAENYNDQHKKRIEKELSIHGGNLIEKKVEVMDINTLLRKYNLFEIDYCSIDVEGSEEKILSELDEKKFDIKVFTVENNYQSKELRKIMKNKGYKLHSQIDFDDVFVKPNKWFFINL
jgi:FkbM family methyltransferase